MIRRFISLFALAGCMLATTNGIAHDEAKDNSWWWNNDWWERGVLPVPVNYEVREEWISYPSGEIEVAAMLARPAKEGRYPAVLFVHGRRGLDELIKRHVRRLAARGYVVLAPDIYNSRFMSTHPIEHDYELEKDVDKSVDALLARDDISTSRACLYSHTRGGYYSLKVATTFGRQQKDIACYVSYYPHLQDPNAPEPLQIYSYAPEVDALTIPVLIFVGEDEQYQRMRVIQSSVASLESRGRDVRLIEYPGVGRGFDFRPENVRTFADDLASRDAIQRADKFMRRHLLNECTYDC